MSDATAIVIIDKIYEFLSVGGSEDDTLIQDLINRKTKQFENYLQVDSLLINNYTEYYDGENSPYLFPRNYPINSITSIYDDQDWVWGEETLIDPTQYRIVDGLYVASKFYFYSSIQNIKITYNSGYSIIPEDIVQALVEEVTRVYSRRKEIDIFLKTVADGSVHRYEKALLPATTLTLSKYKRRRVA